MRIICLFIGAIWLSMAQASLLVLGKEERHDDLWTQPRLVMVNAGELAVSSPMIEYRVKVASGQRPVLQWFEPSSGVQVSLHEESDHFYTVRMRFPDLVLAPGEWHNYGNGVRFGLHLVNWGTWELLDDPSYKGPNGNLVVNELVQVTYATNTSSSTGGQSSSSAVSVSSSSVIQNKCNGYLYNGENAKHVQFFPYDWPEPYELLTNHGVLGGAMQPPYLRMSGSKSFLDDWKSIYRFPGAMDLTSGRAQFQLYSTGISSWIFRLVDMDQDFSAPLVLNVPLNTVTTVTLSAEDLAADGFNAHFVSGILFEALGVSAWQYSHNYIDEIQVSCTETPASSSSSEAILSSSSAAGPTLLVRVSGNGTVRPGNLFDFSLGQSVQLWFEPGTSSKLGSLALDGVPLEPTSSLQLTGDGLSHVLDVWFEPVPSNMRALQVVVGTGGRASLDGGYLVAAGSVHSLRLYPDPGYQVKDVLVNGVSQGGNSHLQLGPIQVETRVQVLFTAAPVCQLALQAEGPGKLELMGATSTYCGETRTVKLIPDAAANLAELWVDGQPHELVPFMQIGPLTKAMEVRAVFANATLVQCPLDIQSRHRAGNTEVLLRNVSQSSLEPGWYFDYYTRTGAGETPGVFGWYTPGLSYATLYLGDGYWRTRFTASGRLTSEQQLMAQFGLALQDHSRPWPQTSDWSASEGTEALASNGKIPVYNAQGSLLCGKWPIPDETPDTYSVKVESYDEGCDGQYLKPRIRITNTGTGILSGFYYLYYFTAEPGSIPMIDAAWYNPYATVSLLSYGNNQYALRYDYPFVTLLPGQALPDDHGTNVIGVRYAGWTPLMDRSNDYSFNGNCAAPPSENGKIPVYTYDGSLIGGSEPIPDGGESGLRILRQPVDVTIEEGQAASFSVVVSASTGISYRWMKNGVFINGATQDSYTINVVTLADNGSRYTVEIMDQNGRRVVSNEAVLTVLRPGVSPFFSMDLTDKVVRVGDSVLFEVSAHGISDANLQYQWYVNGQLHSATGEMLDMGIAVMDMDKSRIRAIALSGDRSASSSEAGLRVLPYVPASGRISLSGQLTSVNGAVNGEKSFTVRLYNGKTALNPVYEERFWNSNGMGVRIRDGKWTLQLGTGDSEQSLSQVVNASGNLYVEIWVGQPAYQELAGTRQSLDAVVRSVRASQKRKGE